MTRMTPQLHLQGHVAGSEPVVARFAVMLHREAIQNSNLYLSFLLHLIVFLTCMFFVWGWCTGGYAG